MSLKVLTGISILIITGFLTACTQSDVGEEAFYNSEDNFISSITVCMAESEENESRANENEKHPEIIDGLRVIDPEDYDLSDIKEFNIEFDENTVVFVSQMTSTIPAFQNDEVTYAYSHIPNSDDATWEQGYNFTPGEGVVPLEWYKIGNGGTYHGGFALYAMLFPNEKQIRQKVASNGSITYNVMEDQRTLDNLMRSDILGAFHSTPTLFSRLRFKMYHMMSYLRVRLYVPVYDEITHTGFPEDAINYATVDHVSPDFSVEWSANRSSDSEGPALVTIRGDGTIYMYQHPLKAGTEEHEMAWVKYKDFIGDNYYDQGITGDYDRVRVYDFSVLLPMQTGGNSEDENDLGFLSTEFLNFFIKTSSGATTRYYFKQETTITSDAQDASSDGNSGNETSTGSIQIEQGNIQYLQLYVPRVGNKLIFMNAKVNPWKHRSTKVTLIPTPE